MAQKYHIHLALPNDLRQAIGDVAAFWSFLEMRVAEVMHALLKLDPKRGRIISTQMNLRPRLEIVNLLLEYNEMSDEIMKEFKSAKTEIERLQTHRNEVIHGLWARPDKSLEHHLLWYGSNPKNRVIGKAIPMKAADVRAIAAQIELVTQQMTRVLEGVSAGTLPPSPEIP